MEQRTGDMKDRTTEGLWAWRQPENHNHMIALQEQSGDVPSSSDGIELSYFGGSAFRIKAPSGLTLLLDPWRNPPRGNWDWYLYDFPAIAVDVVLSTHAHFDHDGVHRVSAHTILDRLIGTYAFADVRITGIADKHVSDSTHNAYDWAEMTRRLTNVRTTPPDNWRSFDNCLLVIEVAGLRILHWGDNRPNPPDHVWEQLGEVDILLLPVDGSQHVLSYAQADAIAVKLGARLVVPHHYCIWDVTTQASTLLPPDEWVKGRADSLWAESGSYHLDVAFVKQQCNRILCFGDHVAFDKVNVRSKTERA
ncbi:MBL fold metallo-hydrolase [Methylobacterium sp. A49B]